MDRDVIWASDIFTWCGSYLKTFLSLVFQAKIHNPPAKTRIIWPIQERLMHNNMILYEQRLAISLIDITLDGMTNRNTGRIHRLLNL